MSDTRRYDYIEDLLLGKCSNATASFFCGEYFCKTITENPRFNELQELVWAIQARLYKKLSKKAKSQRSLNLTSSISGFFNNPNLENNPTLLLMQKEILGDWADVHHYFGVSINWHKVFKSAYDSGNILKTNQDYNNLESLQEIPLY